MRIFVLALAVCCFADEVKLKNGDRLTGTVTRLDEKELTLKTDFAGDLKIKREGRSPNVRLRISRKEVANPPAAIRRLVPATTEVSHTEDWSADGDGYAADIAIDIKGVPVKIVGTKTLQPEKGGCSVEWKFDVTSGIPLLGGIIASFAGSEIEKKLEAEFKVLKSLA
jgi:hypothetical protein